MFQGLGFPVSLSRVWVQTIEIAVMKKHRKINPITIFPCVATSFSKEVRIYILSYQEAIGGLVTTEMEHCLSTLSSKFIR